MRLLYSLVSIVVLDACSVRHGPSAERSRADSGHDIAPIPLERRDASTLQRLDAGEADAEPVGRDAGAEPSWTAVERALEGRIPRVAGESLRIEGTQDVVWASHGRQVLRAAFPLPFSICADHFPAGSAVRAEIEAAVAEYGAVSGFAAAFSIVEHAHRSSEQLYGDAEARCENPVVYIDYLTEPFPCHDAENWDSCSDWAMNMCAVGPGGWGRLAGRDRCAFNVNVNAACYRHASDSTSSDHPRAAGVLHEMGHGFGMIDTPDWPDADQGLISVMQGGLPLLSAHDVAYLRRQNPTTMPPPEAVELVFSPLARLGNDRGGYGRDAKRYFSIEQNPEPSRRDHNPSDLGWSEAEGGFVDCATRQSPQVAIAWFNRGTATAGAGAAAPLTLAVLLEDSEGAVVSVWDYLELPAMAPESQMQVVLEVRAARPMGWADRATTVRLRAVLNGQRGAAFERADLLGPITLHPSVRDCPVP